jgi:2-polyprenyl-3-methyl-5-hydroxy-6-metoxy-1,4-benzoquinol methylase
VSHRERLFREYYDTHTRHVEADLQFRARWFVAHVRRNYSPHMPHPTERPAILEIGCGKGQLLAALRGCGYDNLAGIDLSSDDLAHAAVNVQDATLLCMDAAVYLAANPAAFDVVISKAVLEHQAKADVIPFLEAVRGALRPGGLALIEVPNMDWLLAGHERYMDFTHEVGFTRESLAQLLRATFGEATVLPARTIDLSPWPVTWFRSVFRTATRAVVGFALRGIGDDAHRTLWYARSIIGLARRSR